MSTPILPNSHRDPIGETLETWHDWFSYRWKVVVFLVVVILILGFVLNSFFQSQKEERLKLLNEYSQLKELDAKRDFLAKNVRKGGLAINLLFVADEDLRNKNFDKTLEDAELFIQVVEKNHPFLGQAWLYKAYALEELGKSSEALKAYQKAKSFGKKYEILAKPAVERLQSTAG